MKLKRKISAALALVVILLSGYSYAQTDSYDVNLKTNVSKVQAEETIQITIRLENLQITSGEKGIGAYSAKLEFDNTILEYVKIEGKENWETPVYQEGLLTSNTTDSKCVTEAQDIAVVTFKVKKEAKVGDTTLKITNFLGSNGENDLKAADKSVTLSIEKKIEINTNTENTDNTQSNTNTNANTSTNSNTNKNNDKTTSSDKIPQTGINDFVVPVIFISIITSVSLYIRYKILK